MFYSFGKILRLGIAWLDMILLTLLLYLFSYLPRTLTEKIYHPLFRNWCTVFIRALNVDLRLHQHYTRPLPNHFILIANHPSVLEDIGVPALFDVYPLSKAEVRDWWILGRIAVASDTLFVQRESETSRKSARQDIIDTLKDGKNIALFPEGGCKGKRIAPFICGAFEISMETGVPILPLFLHYESQDDFEWRDPQTLLHKFWHLLTTQNNKANYHVFDALDPTSFSNSDAYCDYGHTLYLKWQEKYLD